MARIHHEQEAARYYIGTARVNLRNLELNHKWARDHHRPISEKRVEGLKRKFSHQKCQQDVSAKFLVGIAESRAVEEALEKSGLRKEDLQAGSDGCYPILRLEDVWCLEGFHRVEAARQSDWTEEPWWTVKLYSKDLPERVARSFLENTADEDPYSDGDVALKILSSLRTFQADREQEWWGRLSDRKEKNFKQLLKDSSVKEVLLDISQVPGLWPSLVLGPLHTYLAGDCDEEFLNGLNAVRRVWIHEICRGLPIETLKAADKITVDKLESLAPASSNADYLTVQSLMVSKTIFSSIQDESVRTQLTQQICAVSCLIPTLRTFVKNLMYLELGFRPLKKLLGPYKTRGSLRQSFYACYKQPSCRLIEVGMGQRAAYGRQSFESDRWVAWVSLWVFCMREFKGNGNKAPLREKGAKTTPTASIKRSVELELYSLATDMGFNLPRPHADLPNPPRTKGTTQDPPPLLAGEFLELTRRCGRPHNNCYEFDRERLFVPSFFSSIGDKKAELSPFFVKRDFFWTFLADDSSYVSYLGSELEDADIPTLEAPHPRSPLTPTNTTTTNRCTRCAEVAEKRSASDQDAVLNRVKELEQQLADRNLVKQTLEKKLLEIVKDKEHEGSRYETEKCQIKSQRTLLENEISALKAKVLQLEQSEKEKNSQLLEQRSKIIELETTHTRKRRADEEDRLDELASVKRQRDNLNVEVEQVRQQNDRVMRNNKELTDEAEQAKTDAGIAKKKISELIEEGDASKKEQRREVNDLRDDKQSMADTIEKLKKVIDERDQSLRRLHEEWEIQNVRTEVALTAKDVDLSLHKAQIRIEASNWKENQQRDLMDQALQTSREAVMSSRQAMQSSLETVSSMVETLWNAQLGLQELQFDRMASFMNNALKDSGQTAIEFLKSTQISIVDRKQFVMWFVHSIEETPVPYTTNRVDEGIEKLWTSIIKAHRRGQNIVFVDWLGKRIVGDQQQLTEAWENKGIIFAGEEHIMAQWIANGRLEQVALPLGTVVHEAARQLLPATPMEQSRATLEIVARTKDDFVLEEDDEEL